MRATRSQYSLLLLLLLLHGKITGRGSCERLTGRGTSFKSNKSLFTNQENASYLRTIPCIIIIKQAVLNLNWIKHEFTKVCSFQFLQFSCRCDSSCFVFPASMYILRERGRERERDDKLNQKWSQEIISD